MINVLIADDETISLRILYQELSSVGYNVTCAKNGKEVLDYCKTNTYNIIITDIQMPYKSGLDILKEMKNELKTTVFILITAYASLDMAVNAIKCGADDYISKPYDIEDLLKKITQFLAIKKEKSKSIVFSNDEDTSLFGNSALMQQIKQKIKKIRDLHTTVLITGENGTGKGVIAKEIHRTSKNSTSPFIHVDCASLPANLIESELFGFEKGAFTGATLSKKGKFELAGNGTIFLDEIGTLPLELQSKLLNVLQERLIDKLGGTKKISMEARVIAATNENLEKCVANGTFREDLYYRLNVIRIEVPPLRYRKDDIVNLSKIFISKFMETMKKDIEYIEDDFWSSLLAYDWPGNIRELENAIESTLALCDEKKILKCDLPLRITQTKSTQNQTALEIGNKISLKSQEMLTIISALEMFDGHREKTANYLGISRRTLQYKLKKFNLIGKD